MTGRSCDLTGIVVKSEASATHFTKKKGSKGKYFRFLFQTPEDSYQAMVWNGAVELHLGKLKEGKRYRITNATIQKSNPAFKQQSPTKYQIMIDYLSNIDPVVEEGNGSIPSQHGGENNGNQSQEAPQEAPASGGRDEAGPPGVPKKGRRGRPKGGQNEQDNGEPGKRRRVLRSGSFY